MLTGGYREAADATIDINAVGHDAFLCVLSFLYTGKLPREIRPCLSPQLAVDLLGVANLYGIDPLKRLCADIIARNLDCENAAAVLEAAEAHGVPQLRAACTDFIVANFAAVVRTDAFRELIRAETRDLVMSVLLELSHAGGGGGGGGGCGCGPGGTSVAVGHREYGGARLAPAPTAGAGAPPRARARNL